MVPRKSMIITSNDNDQIRNECENFNYLVNRFLPDLPLATDPEFLSNKSNEIVTELIKILELKYADEPEKFAHLLHKMYKHIESKSMDYVDIDVSDDLYDEDIDDDIDDTDYDLYDGADDDDDQDDYDDLYED